MTIVESDSLVREPETPAPVSSYDSELGSILIVPAHVDGADADIVAVISPLMPPDRPVDDTSGLTQWLGDGEVELFSRSGLVGRRTVSAGSAALDPSAPCPLWPTARLDENSRDSPKGVARWSVGFPAGRVAAVPLDSIESLPARDSAALAAALTRLTSALEEDSTSPFLGLPFTVTRAYRTSAPDTGIAVAVLVRRIPQEDQPLEERMFIVVSTREANPRRWSIEWFSRVRGREEEVIATEPLALVFGGSRGRLTLVLGRDDGSGTSLVMLERRGNRWRVRWESPVTGC